MELLPLVLGPNGSRMQQICNQNGITRVVVENARGFIRIVGTDPEMVARARRLLEVVSVEARSSFRPPDGGPAPSLPLTPSSARPGIPQSSRAGSLLYSARSFVLERARERS